MFHWQNLYSFYSKHSNEGQINLLRVTQKCSSRNQSCLTWADLCPVPARPLWKKLPFSQNVTKLFCYNNNYTTSFSQHCFIVVI